jgi:hypothetical protein
MAQPVVVSPPSLTFNAASVGGGPNQSIVGSVQTLSVTEAGGYTGSFTASVDDASVAFFSSPSSTSAQPVIFNIYAYQAGTCNITITDANNQKVVVPVTVTLLANPLVAGAYSASAAIAMCYARTNENSTSVPQATVLSFLNAAIGEIADSLGTVRKFITIPAASNQNVFNLPYDVQDVISASFSTLAPASAGTQVYRLEQLEQNQFFDFTGGLPGTGFGPPLAYMSQSDVNGYQTFQLYPPSSGGLLNIYYRARPTIFTDLVNSTTNLDPQAQELMIYWACARICEARERYTIAERFDAQYDKNLEESKDIISRRTAPKSGQVRDVTSSGRPGTPPWLG